MSEEPLLRVERGTPTPEELAAIVGVLWARGQAVEVAAPKTSRPPAWRASGVPRAGRLPSPGPGAWRSAR